MVRATGLDLHCAPSGEHNKGSAASSRSGQRSPALHLDGFKSFILRINKRCSGLYHPLHLLLAYTTQFDTMQRYCAERCIR